MGIIKAHRKTWATVAVVFFTTALLVFTPLLALAQAQTNSPGGDPGSAGRTESGQNVDIAAELGFTATAKLVYDALTSIGSWFTFMGGLLLDTSLSWFVWGMAETTVAYGLDKIIDTVWTLVRDLFNLLFIFGLIWAGFQLILGIDSSGSKRNIVTIVIAALLINFSLYAAQIVVDFANIASVEISKLIQPSQGAEVMGRPVFNIADSFVAATDLTNLSSTTLSSVTELSSGVIDIPSRGIGFGQALVIGLTVALMLIVLGFVFAAGAVLMFVRYFYLLFLMMFSPIMVLGWILPGFKSRSKEWWETLFKQALIGPAYLFMIYVSLLALGAFADSPSNQSIASFIMMSLMVSGFAWASLMVAKNMGAVGASQAMKWGEGMARKARGGVTGYAGRNTLGRFGDWYEKRLDKRGVSDKDPRRSFAASLAGKKYGGSYSQVDARNSSEKADVKKARFAQVQKINSAISAGQVAASGSQARIDMEKAITSASNEQIIEMLGEHKAGSPEYERITEHMSAGQFDAVMKAKPDELDDKAKDDLETKRRGYVKNAVQSLGGISKASDAQLKVLGAKEIVAKAADLKQSQFDDIMKSKDYTETEKNNIRKAREDELWNRFDTGQVNIFNGLQDKDIANLPKAILMDNQGRQLQHLSGGALRKIAEDDKLTSTERQVLLGLITAPGAPAIPSTAQAYLNSPQGQEKYG